MYGSEPTFAEISPADDMLNYLLNKQRSDNVYFLQTHLGAFRCVIGSNSLPTPLRNNYCSSNESIRQCNSSSSL